MADMNEVYDALRKADAAGDVESVGKLIAYINSQQAAAAPAPQPSMADNLMRQLSLTGRAATPAVAGALLGAPFGGPIGAATGAAVATLGPMIADPMVQLFNRAAGTNIPTASQGIESLMTRMGMAEPQTPQERISYDIARAAAGGAGAPAALGRIGTQMGASAIGAGQMPSTTANVLQTMAKYPAQQIAASGLSAGTGASLREGGASGPAQLLGALGAGMMAPGGPKLPITQRAIAAPKTLVQPFTEPGREVIIGNLLNRLATNPEQAQRNLAAGAPLVPGVRPTTAALARDPGLAAAETPIRALDQSGAFAQTLSANQQKLLEAYRRISGKPGSIEAAETKRYEVTAPLRTQSFANSTPVPAGPVLQAVNMTLADPMKQRQSVDQAMAYVQQLVNKRIDPETGTIDPRALYSVRKDITDAMSGKLSGDLANIRLARGELAQLLPVIDNVIESGAPGFQRYMSQFAKSSSAIDQMRLLQGIESKVTTGQPNLMTGEPVLAASALRRQLAAKSEDIGADLSPAAQTKLDNIINEINRGQAATAPGVKAPGSDTFRNMSMGNLIGRVFSESMASNTTLRSMTRPLDFLYKLPDEKIQQLLVEAMLDPKIAAVMMSKANMMKVDPLAKSLRQKAEQLGFGSELGAAQAGE